MADSGGDAAAAPAPEEPVCSTFSARRGQSLERAPLAPDAKRAEYARMEKALGKFFDKYPVDSVGRMATVSSFLRLHFPRNVFCGFYTVARGEPRRLQIGPYNGNGVVLACGLIDFGKGVCGACAAARTTQVVPDVREFPGYIACDEESLSEIVVPVFGRNRHDEPDAPAAEGAAEGAAGAAAGERELTAVLDLDADIVGAYDEVDRECLERICARCF